MKIYKELEQGSPEWFAVRIGKLTSSKGSAIATAGKGLETLVYEKVAEILTGKMVMIEPTDAMKHGVEMEEEARNAYEIETGRTVEQVGFIEEDKYSGSSPDGLVGLKGMAEFKCPTDKVFVKYMYTKKIESGYLWQMQDQMLISGREWNDFCVYNPNFPNPLIIQRVMRDEVKIAKLRVGRAKGVSSIKSILEAVK